MAWRTIASGTSIREFKEARPRVSDVPPGTRMRLIISTPWYAPIAPLADLFSAEWVARRLYQKAKTRITDVEGKGWHTIIVHMKAIGTPTALIIGVIAALLFGVGVVISSIKLDMEEVPAAMKKGAEAAKEAAEAMPETAKWGGIGLLALAAIVLMPKPRR